MKDLICGSVGLIGSAIAAYLGGWDTALQLLVIMMVVDYVTGFICAAVFHKSRKTKSGSLKSNIGFKGLCKKGVILCFVLIAHMVGQVVGSEYVRDAVIIGFCVNELISIIENAGLMGVPIPPPVKRMLDALQVEKEETK